MTSKSKPIGENKPTPKTAGESKKQPNQPEIPVPLTPTPESQCQPPRNHCEITYKTEKGWWDKTKPFVEMAGILLLAVYTLYTIKMYRANKKAADAATRAATAAEEQGKLAYVEERAWVGAGRPSLMYKRSPQKGETVPPLSELLAVRVKVTNTGRTPAINLRIGATGAIVPQGQGIVATNSHQYDYSLMGNLPPNGDAYKEITIKEIWPDVLTKGDIAILTSPRPTHRLFVLGMGSYNDVINPKIKHWFTFSFFMLPTQDAFGVDPNQQNNDIWDQETK